MSKAIIVENLSKLYRLGEVGTGTLSHDLNRFWAKIRGKEDPFAKLGQVNDRSQKAESDYVWSLKDINFEVEQGDAVGIIGKNGAGKSTLLKILSRVTAPTTGNIKVKGRIASLLEVGTGFHPEMTGRENIYMNGAILGMRKKEITRKLEEIIDFSGVERYIDTPVKRYSSGMYVRLAFAVAAHLESEILIVDEVLAVGDAEFQKKCLGKMGDISKGEGRTVLFVSHNMAAVKSFCKSGIVLENGTIKNIGQINQAILNYNSNNILSKHSLNFRNISAYNNSNFELIKISLLENNGEELNIIEENTDIIVETVCNVMDDLNKYHLSFVFKNSENLIVFTAHNSNRPLNLGNNKVKFTIPNNFLNIDTYYISLYIIKNKQISVLFENDFLSFNIIQSEKDLGEWMGKEPGIIKTNFNWKYE
jgi:lipopolysaccharide transport system ATP-binding protein